MNMIDREDTKVAGFILRGLLASESLEQLQVVKGRTGELTFADIASKVSIKLLDQENVDEAVKMSAVYIAIASFENSVRELISSHLLEEKGADWWNSCISGDIRKRAEQKMKEEQQIRWHQARGLNPIYSTELKDLTSIIQQNWPSFEALLHDMDWVRHLLRTVERSRNVIMHSGQLAIDDIERIGMNIRDWIRQVGG
jgi:hypothetical protein